MTERLDTEFFINFLMCMSSEFYRLLIIDKSMSIKTNRPACNANTTFMILITSYIPYSQKVGETTNKKELHSKIFCKIEKNKKERS